MENKFSEHYQIKVVSVFSELANRDSEDRINEMRWRHIKKNL